MKSFLSFVLSAFSLGRRHFDTLKRINIASVFLLSIIWSTTACGPNQRILNSAAETSTNASIETASNIQAAASSFEQDLNAMRTADFTYIYAFRRKDGAALNADDKKFLSGVTPLEINRRRLSDEDRAVILGSNYRLPPEMLKVLTARFAFENYSKPESEIVASNTNSTR